MSDAAIAVNIAGYTGDSCFHIPVTTSSTAGGIIALVKECLPQCLWHGNTMLSCGLHQLRPDTIVDTRRLGAWVLINFSEISNQEKCWCRGEIAGAGIQDELEVSFDRDTVYIL